LLLLVFVVTVLARPFTPAHATVQCTLARLEITVARAIDSVLRGVRKPSVAWSEYGLVMPLASLSITENVWAITVIEDSFVKASICAAQTLEA
jgi:hypothetical protein